MTAPHSRPAGKPQQQADHTNTPTIRIRAHNTADNGNKKHAPKNTTAKKINKNSPTTGRAQATHHTHAATPPRQPPPQPAPGSPRPAMDEQTLTTGDDGNAIIPPACSLSGLRPAVGSASSRARSSARTRTRFGFCGQLHAGPVRVPLREHPTSYPSSPHADTRENTRSATTATNPFLHTRTARLRDRALLQAMHARATDTDYTHTLRLRLCR